MQRPYKHVLLLSYRRTRLPFFLGANRHPQLFCFWPTYTSIRQAIAIVGPAHTSFATTTTASAVVVVVGGSSTG
jgi:hypothetical protein